MFATVEPRSAVEVGCRPVARWLLGGAMLALAVPAYAQDALPQPADDAAEAEDTGVIVVTARKREEAYQDVPVAMQVLTADDVNRYAASNLNQIGELATQVQILPTAAGTGSSFVVRGISSSNADVAINSSVVINQDGFAISRGRTVQTSFFDIAGVEVLKGPQSLFYGKNSPAGVISIRTALPTPNWELSGKGYYEFNAREFTGEAIASGPLSDTLGLRLAYRGTTSRGWLKNVAGPLPFVFPREPFNFPGALDSHFGGRTGHLGRVTLQYDPTDNLRVNLRVSANRDRLDASSLRELVSCGRGFPASLNIRDPFGDCKLNGVISAGAYQRELQVKHLGMQDLESGDSIAKFDGQLGILNIDYDAGDFSISSVTGAHHYKWFQFDNFDATVYNLLGGNQHERWTQYSQELRLLSELDGPLNFMIGGFFEKTRRGTENNCKIAPLGFDPATGNANSCSLHTKTRSSSLSGFAQVIFTPTDELEITGGARISREEVKGRVFYPYVHSLLRALFLPVGTELRPRITDTDISPEATMRYKITPHVSVYAAYKTGYKAGGHSAAAIIPPTATANSILYQPEKARGGEIGLKAVLLDRKLRANVTAYHYLFDDGQDAVFIGATTSFEIRNADSKATGIEFDMAYQPVPGLNLTAQLGYNEARYRNYDDAACWNGQTLAEGCRAVINPANGLPRNVQDISGRIRALAPKWTGGAGFDFETPISNGLKMGFSLNGNYVGKQDTQAVLNPFARQDAYMKVNAAARLGDIDDRWELAVIAQNLTNTRYWGNAIDQPGGARGDITADAIRPQQIALQGKFKF